MLTEPTQPFTPATAPVVLAAIVRMILIRNEEVNFYCGDPVNGDRVYHQMADEGITKAHVVITRQSAERPRTMDGKVNFVRGTIRVDVFAPDAIVWVPLVKAVGNALDNPNSDGVVVANARVSGIKISYLEADDEQDIPVQPLPGEAGPSMRGTAMFFNYMIEPA